MKKNARYLEIENELKLEISSKTLRPNQQIMTEEQLCERYNVSRMTVNKAISNLVNSGYIYRIPGRGSFVRNPQVVKPIGMGRSFTEDMLAMGLEPSAKLLEYKVLRGYDIQEVAEKLQLEPSDLIHYFVRIRSGDDLPIGLSYTYVSSKCVPAINLSALESSFYEYIKGLGLEIGQLEGDFRAVLPTDEQREILCVKNEAMLLYSHVTYLKDGTAMEYIKTYYIGSRYSYSFTGESTRDSCPPIIKH